MKKKVGVKKVKKLKNLRRETQNVPVKEITNMAKNLFHGHFAFSREKKALLSRPHNTVYGFLRQPGHFFSSIELNIKTQPAGGRAAVWLSF